MQCIEFMFYSKKVILRYFFYILISSISNEPNYGLNIFSFEILSRIFNIPVSSVWWDTCNHKTMNFLNNYQLILHKRSSLLQTYATDNPSYYPLQRTNFNRNFATKKVIGIFTPYNPKTWSPSKIKDIDVLFIGQVSSFRSIRKKYIKELRNLESNYKVVLSLLDRDKFISWDEYISLSRRSVI